MEVFETVVLCPVPTYVIMTRWDVDVPWDIRVVVVMHPFRVRFAAFDVSDARDPFGHFRMRRAYLDDHELTHLMA